MAAYEKAALQTFEMGDFQVKLLYQSPEYVVAREINAGTSPQEAKAMAQRYAKGIYVSLTIIPKVISGTPEDLQKDILNSSLIAGEDKFRERLAYFQGGLTRKVHLEDPDKNVILPSTYTFSRSFGVGRTNTFLYAFPSRFQDRELDLKKIELVVDDFGLNAGAIHTRLKNPGSLTLRVPND